MTPKSVARICYYEKIYRKNAKYLFTSIWTCGSCGFDTDPPWIDDKATFDSAMCEARRRQETLQK